MLGRQGWSRTRVGRRPPRRRPTRSLGAAHAQPRLHSPAPPASALSCSLYSCAQRALSPSRSALAAAPSPRSAPTTSPRLSPIAVDPRLHPAHLWGGPGGTSPARSHLMARQPPGALIELEQDPALAELVREWDFSLGKRFEAEVVHKFSSLHHPSSSPDGSFFLLVVFRRFLFRLTEDSVALALHCCLGGAPTGFHVTYQSDRHFHFSVASKHVGLLIRSLRRITTAHFDAYFHLWRDGGDN